MGRRVNKIVVHCSDSPDGRDDSMMDIDRWHQERGFSGVTVISAGKKHQIYCGYHFVIRIDGTIETGRPESFVGAHVQGSNANSIGVCWIGRHKMSDEARESVLTLLNQLITKYALSISDVYGHCELAKGKTCPNIDMDSLRGDLSILHRAVA